MHVHLPHLLGPGVPGVHHRQRGGPLLGQVEVARSVEDTVHTHPEVGLVLRFEHHPAPAAVPEAHWDTQSRQVSRVLLNGNTSALRKALLLLSKDK